MVLFADENKEVIKLALQTIAELVKSDAKLAPQVLDKVMVLFADLNWNIRE